MTKEANRTYLGVQALRAVAALMVVTIHAFDSWNSRILQTAHGVGWTNNLAGVDIFFVISGFVMTVTAPGLLGYPNKAATFLWRRCIRIIPLYWIFTTLKLVQLQLTLPPGARSFGGPWHVAASYLFLPSAGLGTDFVPVLAVGWTLNFEMLFYVLFAVALALKIPLLAFVAPALVALTVAGGFYQPSWPPVTTLASPIILEFLFGMLLAHGALHGRLPGKTLGWLLLVGGFVAIELLPLPAYYGARAVCWGLPALAIVTGVVTLEDDLRKRLPRWLLEAGNASYSIYLVHVFVITPIWFVLLRTGARGPGGLVAMIVLALGLSMLAGEVVHRLIELPLLRLLRGSRTRGADARPA